MTNASTPVVAPAGSTPSNPTPTPAASLNQGQENAASAIFQFLLGPDKEFILSGPAGVGKTFMMKHIMDNVMREYEDGCTLLGMKPLIDTIQLTATTNKAAEVLQESTGFPTSTIHSFLSLKVKDDYKTGKSKIEKTENWKVHTGTLIMIDEVSMMDTPTYNLLMEGTDKSCKIIYIGDHNQLAPVFEKLSPVYKNWKNSAVLTELVRNADQPALMNLCQQFRNTVENGDFQPIQPVPGVIDYIDDAGLKHMLDTEFANEEVKGRILCYTNNRVHQYNDYIRGVRGYPETFTAGERIVCGSATAIGKTILRVEQEFRVHKVLTKPHDTDLGKDAQGNRILMKVYEIEIIPMVKGIYGGSTIRVSIPVDRDHHRELLKYFGRMRMWSQYWDLKNGYPDLRQKDACTVYKSQGSTYDFCILDLTDIGKERQSDKAARMLYVGVSRPRKRLFLYGQLPSKYGGR